MHSRAAWVKSDHLFLCVCMIIKGNLFTGIAFLCRVASLLLPAQRSYATTWAGSGRKWLSLPTMHLNATMLRWLTLMNSLLRGWRGMMVDVCGATRNLVGHCRVMRRSHLHLKPSRKQGPGNNKPVNIYNLRMWCSGAYSRLLIRGSVVQVHPVHMPFHKAFYPQLTLSSQV